MITNRNIEFLSFDFYFCSGIYWNHSSFPVVLLLMCLNVKITDLIIDCWFIMMKKKSKTVNVLMHKENLQGFRYPAN